MGRAPEPQSHWRRAAFRVIAWLGVTLAMPAWAGERDISFAGLDEIRFGLSQHSIEPDFSEDGLDADVELIFERLGGPERPMDWLESLLRPRPQVGARVSLADETSRVFAGFLWEVPLTERVSLELGFGGAIHDGPLDRDGTASYGCRWSFRETAGIGVALSEQWQLIAGIEHMSNADLCARNRGLTSAGVRLGYRLP